MGRRVLLVDDDELIRRVGARILARAGFQPIVAEGASAALAFVDARIFDAAILDYFLFPGECGCDIIAPLRANNPAIRIAVLSGLGDLPDVIRHAHQAGADVVASKFRIDWAGLARGESPPAPPPCPSVNIDILKRNAIHGTYLVHHRNVSHTARALGVRRGNLQRILRKQPPPHIAEDES